MEYSHTEGATPAFLTMDEVLGYLRVTSRTIYRLIKAGELPAVRVGRQWRFRQRDLDAWLSRQQTNVN
jgi:excisionase family DNA binding protein